MQDYAWDKSSFLSDISSMNVIRELTSISRSSKRTLSRKNKIRLLSMELQQSITKKAVEESFSVDFRSADAMVVKVLMLSLRGTHWVYRGEGNANVVIALPQEHKVIRLRKGNKYGIYSSGETSNFLLEAKFYAKVMIPLLGAFFVKPPTLICIERQEILELEAQLVHLRPAARLDKGIASVDAAVYMDYTILPANLRNETFGAPKFPTFCVEIKPKQGWVPKPDRQFHKCSYCLHQYLKVITEEVENHSRYCPLDLFSGNFWRMKKALRALLDTPQNNFKIFQDGSLVYGEGVNNSALPILRKWLSGPSSIHDSEKLIEKFCYVLVEALTRDVTSPQTPYEVIGNSKTAFISLLGNENCNKNGEVKNTVPPGYRDDYNIGNHDHEGIEARKIKRLPADLLRTAKVAASYALKSGKEFSCQWDTHDQDKFPKNCVLQRILGVQKLDIFGADHAYQEYRQKLQLYGTLPNFSYIPSLLTSESLSSVHRYLLSTTAKDCSIMVSFQEQLDNRSIKHHNQYTINCPDGQKFLFNIGIVDLEPKPLSCFEKHVLRDCEVLKAYVKWNI